MRWYALIGVIVFLLTIHIGFFSHIFEPWRGKSFDIYQRLHSKLDDKQVLPVIVVIDDETLQETGRWPWSRKSLAVLIKRIHDARPSVLGIDILFPETQSAEEDAALAKAIAAGPSVLATSIGGIAANEDRAPLIIWSEIGSEYQSVVPVTAGLVMSTDIITSAASGLGIVRSTPDPDAVVRSAPLVWATMGADGLVYWPHFAMELARLHLNDDAYAVRLAPNGYDALRFASRIVPLSAGGGIWLQDADVAAEIISARTLNDPMVAARLKGRMVVLAVSALGLDTFHKTPRVLARPGSEIHALLARQLVNDQFLSEPSHAAVVERLLFVVASATLLFVSFVAGGRLSLVIPVALLASAVPFAYGFWQYLMASQLFDFIQPMVGIAFVAVNQITLLYASAELQRRRLRRQFSLFLSPEVVSNLQSLGKDPTTQAEKREITAVMIDIRGFTSSSENLSPEQLVATVNRFMTITSAEIFRFNGTIDKFMGDAVLAFWNAPLDQENHRDLALNCVKAIYQSLKHENEVRRASGEMPILIGAGIETGICSVGNFGSQTRLEYTAIGNAVNMSARLESATKRAGEPILLGPAFVQGASKQARFVGDYELAGFSESVAVYAPNEEAA